ncbi:MAG: segregation and condensation protein B, partial [Parcubacteria group bacterium Gr01-1014_107]
KLSAILKKEEGEIKESLDFLDKRLTGGLRLILSDKEVMLGTAPELSPLISELTKEELNRDLGKAGLETLSIILYRGPVSKKEIDYLRGVNSSFILRNLSIRGLIERFEKAASRSAFYRPTLELLSFLGIKRIEELPEYREVREQIKKLKEETQEKP